MRHLEEEIGSRVLVAVFGRKKGASLSHCECSLLSGALQGAMSTPILLSLQNSRAFVTLTDLFSKTTLDGGDKKGGGGREVCSYNKGMDR